MPRLTFILLAQFFSVYLSLTNENDIKQMYMSVQHDTSFRILDPTNTIAKLSFNTPFPCISMCLEILGCRIVTYDSTDTACKIYNSTDGHFNQATGSSTYTVIDITDTTNVTVGSTTTESDILPTETAISTTSSDSTTTTETVTSITSITTTTTEISTLTTESTTITTESITTTTVVVTSTPVPTSSCVMAALPSFDTNLLALWRFDNNYNDSEGLYPGTAQFTSFRSPGYMNDALDLSGGDQLYVNTSYINLTFTNFTIEAWVRLSSPLSSSPMTILSQSDIILRISSAGVVYASGAPSSTATSLSANIWYHITLVYDVSTRQQSIYVDGALYSTSNIPVSSLMSSPFNIGAYYDGSGSSDYFNGFIDHLSITTRMKSPCEIRRDASLIASYSFGTNTGTLMDSGPYGNNPFFPGSPDFVTGVVGQAILLYGTYLQISDVTGLTQATSGFSFTMFVKMSTISSYPLIYLSSTTNITDSEARPYLGISSSGQLVANIPPSVDVETSMDIPPNEWTHVALTYSSSHNNVSLYLKGRLQISVPGPAVYAPAITAPPVYLTVGISLNGVGTPTIPSGAFSGEVDEINIWSRELSADEVLAAASVAY